MVTAALFVLWSVTAAPCGTIDLWSKQYTSAKTTDEKLNALKFIHCDPVVNEYIKNGMPLVDQDKLYAMYTDALMKSKQLNMNKSDRYTADLVMKGYINFKLYTKTEGRIAELGKRLAGYYHITYQDMLNKINAIKPNHAVWNRDNVSQEHNSYSATLRAEMRSIFL